LPAADDPNRERTLNLQESLNHIVHGSVLGRLRVGMRVLDLSNGRVLYSRRGSVLMDPASNQKVLATATALLRLGSTWHFRTELSGPSPDGEGVIAGDLVLHGTGDPSLRSGHLDEMAQDLVRRGVTRVDGRVLGDVQRIGAGEASNGRSPLHLSWSAIEVRVRPGDKVGAAAPASLYPNSEAFRLVNQTTTVKGRNRVGVSIARVGDHFQVTVSGRVGLGRRGVVIRRSPPSDTLFAAITMRAALISAGIEVRGAAGVYAPDERAHVAETSLENQRLAVANPAGDTSLPLLHRKPGPAILAVHQSAPLPLLIRRVNKNSDNEWAERVLEAAGAETYGGSTSTSKGVRALREAMSDLGISNGYNPANGSGLGHQNRVTPSTMADLLQKLYFDPRVGPDLLQSLSVGGVDGTTRNRFRGSSAAERVRAKTGTLNGVSCLSGYVGDKSGVLAFAIMVEGHRHRAVPSVRSAQVSAVNAMMRYARGTLGPAPGEDAPAGRDLESGGESAEVEGETDLSETPADTSNKPSESIDQMLKDFGKPGNEP
jgi:D-alanyl-D-alanine carboxypeptidase/D-alanyl-D-alanine-endopeptidase (penicillin-binding protein 4)